MRKMIALCPTFRHPDLLAASLEMFLMKDSENKYMIILDDGGTFQHGQSGDGWELNAIPEVFPMIGDEETEEARKAADDYKMGGRFPFISHKYNWMVERAETKLLDDPDIGFCVWEDDDIYAPRYISSHAAVLEEHDYSKPDQVWSDYNLPVTGELQPEGAIRRFHSSMAFTLGLIKEVNGWPEDNMRADFDQQLMVKLEKGRGNRPPSPWNGLDDCQFIYHWHTGSAHCQSTMRDPGDETWYQRGEDAYKKVDFVGKLVPRLDMKSKMLLNLMGVQV